MPLSVARPGRPPPRGTRGVDASSGTGGVDVSREGTQQASGAERRRLSRLLTSLGIGMLVTALCLPIAYLPGVWLLRALQLQGADALFRLQSPPAVERARARDVKIVAIDDRSQDELGAWMAWPRSYYAAAIDDLTAAGARVIVLDLVLASQAPDDDVLARAIERSGRVVEPLMSAQSDLLPATRDGYPVYRRAVRPAARLADAAATLAASQVRPGDDGVVRAVPVAAWMDGRLYPSISLAAVSTYLRRPEPLDHAVTNHALELAGRDIPVDDAGSMLIHYVGPPSTPRPNGAGFQIISFADLVRGSVDAAAFRGSIVFVGVHGSTGFADAYWTPTSTAGSGPMDLVEIHANATATILAGGLPSEQAVFLRDQGAGSSIVIAAAMSALAAVAVAMLTTWQAGTVALLLLVGYNAVMARLWWAQGIVPNLLLPTIVVVGTLALGAAYRVAFDERERRHARHMMARYLSPAVLDAVLADPAKLSLGGERREVTVVFSDIREFTALSERLDPQTLVELLTAYLGAMSEALMRHDGVLDKFIGDQVMGFWGAPVEQPHHAIMACEAALDMLAAVEALNRDWAARGLPPLTVGVGINTGIVSVGNFGSPRRFDYTVVGDPVNTCSRLQELNKDYGTGILITESTRRAIGGAFVTRFIDEVSIRGRGEPLVMYELLARARDGEPPAFLADWEEGVCLLRAGAVAEAEVAFLRVLQSRPGDAPARLYLARCASRVDEPVGYRAARAAPALPSASDLR